MRVFLGGKKRGGPVCRVEWVRRALALLVGMCVVLRCGRGMARLVLSYGRALGVLV